MVHQACFGIIRFICLPTSLFFPSGLFLVVLLVGSSLAFFADWYRNNFYFLIMFHSERLRLRKSFLIPTLFCLPKSVLTQVRFKNLISDDCIVLSSCLETSHVPLSYSTIGTPMTCRTPYMFLFVFLFVSVLRTVKLQ